MKKNDNTTNFMGLKIVSSAKSELLKNIFSQVESGTDFKIVFTPNPEQLVYAKSHSWFDKVLGKADFLLPDGMGIIIGSQILSVFGKSEPILERIAGIDVVSSLLQQFSTKKILIVGGREYSGKEYQKWKIVPAGKKLPLYWHEGFLNVTQPTSAEKRELLERISQLQPDIVFVALGAPYQEKWIVENSSALQESGVRLAMAVGGSFDVLLGKVARSPKWMQGVGLEWLFRLYQEPWRWRRQLNLLVFLKMIVQEALS
ncbi:WecB/TagA/CpsF family glycosyltransferase [Candidatus Woesebacteria bacterium]|nr:WecB/TagA/CpsF family glycosyltransferase [Candidatus Woesebacteria bacterium]